MRLRSSQLYDVAPHDAPTFVFLSLLLLAAGMVACVLPALRAARWDPIGVLKDG